MVTTEVSSPSAASCRSNISVLGKAQRRPSSRNTMTVPLIRRLSSVRNAVSVLKVRSVANTPGTEFSNRRATVRPTVVRSRNA